MKKLFLTAVIALGLATMGFAQGGIFERGDVPDYGTDPNSVGLVLPSQHGSNDDFNGDAPLGSGIAVLLGLGAAYLVGKKRKD